MAADPAAFRVIREEGKAPFLLTCDHASLALPPGYGTLGLPEAELARHIGWDIGAAKLTEALSEGLDACAVLSGYSRLLIDCNRAPDDPTLICELSDGAVVAGNRGIGPAEVAKRLALYHTPYHAALAAQIALLQKRVMAPPIVSVHSFTPSMRGRSRPWHVGILWNKDPRLAVPLLEKLGREPDIMVGDNEPYSGRDNVGYTMRRHGAEAGLPHVLLEIRQDELLDEEGVERWAGRLARILAEIMAEGHPFAVERY